MRVLFCRPSSPQDQSDGFDLEADALQELGLEPLWISADAVVGDQLDRALDGFPDGVGSALLRSWMLTEEEYDRLYEALSERGCYLVNNAAAYAAAHYLPNYYAAIEEWAAPTRWIVGTDLNEAWAVASELGPPPYLLKDHVKAAKENRACSYVPAGASRVEFEEVCRSFIDHRRESFERGLVFRAVLPLEPLTLDSSGQPAFDEYRLFFWQGSLLAAAPYYDVAGDETDFARFEVLGERIDSDFFTVDVARLTTGEWAVIEVGDGGVSTLPPLMDPRGFYRTLLTSGHGGMDRSSG